MKLTLCIVGIFVMVNGRPDSLSSTTYTANNLHETFREILNKTLLLREELKTSQVDVKDKATSKLMDIEDIEKIQDAMNLQFLFVKYGTTDWQCGLAILESFENLAKSLLRQVLKNVTQDENFFKTANKTLNVIEDSLVKHLDDEKQACLSNSNECKVPKFLNYINSLFEFTKTQKNIVQKKLEESDYYTTDEEAEKIITKNLAKAKECNLYETVY